MHFAAKYTEQTYGELASDYKVLVELNMKAMEDFGIDLLSRVDLEEAYNTVDSEVIRCGNLNLVTIHYLSPEKTKEASKELCNKEKNQKYILSGGSEITVNRPPENLQAMREASLK